MPTDGPIFYVYEHWRPDQDVCFWVGKGKGNRAYRFRRNFHYNNVVAKLARLGMCVEVRLVKSGMDESDALALEIERIDFWRSNGIILTNCTDGGEGVTGLRHSAETRAKLSLATSINRLGKKLSEETKKKISISNQVSHPKGVKNPKHGDILRGRKHSLEHKVAIAKALKGRRVSVVTREKIRQSNFGKKRTEQTRIRLRISHEGKTATPDTRLKMTEAQTERWKNTEGLRESVIEKMKDRWRDPEYRSRIMESRRLAAENPDFRNKLRIAGRLAWARRKERANASN